MQLNAFNQSTAVSGCREILSERGNGMNKEPKRDWYGNYEAVFEDLTGKTLISVEKIDCEDGDEIKFIADDGSEFKLFHSQDCCESVTVESITGDLSDLVGSPILKAEEATSDKNPEGFHASEYQDSFTWTFYKLATAKGYVDIRWLGESNGYYSESVSFGMTKLPA